MNPANYEYQSEFARRYFFEGKAELLVKLATLKFGSLTAAAQEQIHSATAAELDQMAERLLGAATLDELLRSAPSTVL